MFRTGTTKAQAPAETPPSDARVTPAELGLFLDWIAEINAAVRQDEPTEARIARAKRESTMVAALLAREPFKTGTKGSAMRAVVSAFYISGAFFRDEKELTALRKRYGAELIDSIASQEALFHQKLDR